MMNTVKQDRKELRRLIESYGINDVVKFVNAINEDAVTSEGKQAILDKYYKKIYDIIAKIDAENDALYYNDVLSALQRDNYKAWIIEKVLSPLYDAGIDTYSKKDGTQNLKFYIMQVANNYMMRFFDLVHFRDNYKVRTNPAFRYVFVEIFKAAMVEAKKEEQARETQAQEDADIQAGLDAKPGNFAEFDTSNQRTYLLSQINTYTQTVAESKNAHLAKATKDCLIIKSNYPEIGYVYLRPDGAWFYKDESGSVHAYRLTEGALKYFRVKDAKGANFIAEWCKLFMVDQKYIDKREWRVDANASETWLEK